jgi:hypothetical protein
VGSAREREWGWEGMEDGFSMDLSICENEGEEVLNKRKKENK